MVDVSSCFSRAKYPNETWTWPGPTAGNLPQAGYNVKPVKDSLVFAQLHLALLLLVAQVCIEMPYSHFAEGPVHHDH
jgi:hypothetical protein